MHDLLMAGESEAIREDEVVGCLYKEKVQNHDVDGPIIGHAIYVVVETKGEWAHLERVTSCTSHLVEVMDQRVPGETILRHVEFRRDQQRFFQRIEESERKGGGGYLFR
jgi:hypothetical protein